MADTKPGDIVKLPRDNRLWVVLEAASPHFRVQAIPAGEIKIVKRDGYTVQDIDRLLGRYAKMVSSGPSKYFAHSLIRRRSVRMRWYEQSLQERLKSNGKQ